MEDNEQAGWFHCGRCGAFFGAEVGAGVPERCPTCERDPVIEHSEMAFAQAAGGSDSKRSNDGVSEMFGMASQGRGKPKRKKDRNGLALFVGIWVVLLVLLAGAVNYFRGGSEEKDDQLGFKIATNDDSLISEELNECKRKVVGYLRAGVPEHRVEFVMNPAKAARRMSSWQQDVAYSDSEKDPQNSIINVIQTPIGKGIETVWEADGSRNIEAVFFPDKKGEWKIDWANMVRYSDQEWPLFLAGSGSDESEFRLLARRRSEDPSGKGRVGSVVLIAPRPGLGEVGVPSPEVKVDPDSRIGRALSTAFAKRDAGEGVYGSKASGYDPNGMIRLRVKVLREGDSERTFVIREILACHWYDFDGLGLDE